MYYELLTGPIVGTVVGYCTNYIAVKMLFRPLKPIKIGKFNLPFTPGIIPKGKERLAKALGEMIGGTLLTEEDFEKALYSENVKEAIKKSVDDFLTKNEESEMTLEAFSRKILKDDIYEESIQKVEEKLTQKVVFSLDEMDIGNVIADKILEALKEKVQGTFLQMMVNDKLLTSLKEPIKIRIEEYIQTDGQEMIEKKIAEECSNFSNKKVSNILEYIEKSGINISDIILEAYEKVLKNKLSGIVKKINVKKIVEEKIIDMDLLELEKLIMQVMKKELNAVINLGALIGFILGCVTILVK